MTQNVEIYHECMYCIRYIIRYKWAHSFCGLLIKWPVWHFLMKDEQLRLLFLFFPWQKSSQWTRASTLSRLHDHRHTHIHGRTPLDEWSAHRRDLYLTTHICHLRRMFMYHAGFATLNPSRRVAADQRLRPRGHRDRQSWILVSLK